MRNADVDALEEEYTRGYDLGYAMGVSDAEPYERAVRVVQEELEAVVRAVADPDRLMGYELHEMEGRQELAREVLQTIFSELVKSR